MTKNGYEAHFLRLGAKHATLMSKAEHIKKTKKHQKENQNSCLKRLAPKKQILTKENARKVNMEKIEGILKSKDHTISYLRHRLKIVSQISPNAVTNPFGNMFHENKANKIKPICIVEPYKYNPFKNKNQ